MLKAELLLCCTVYNSNDRTSKSYWHNGAKKPNSDWYLHCYIQYLLVSGIVTSGLDCINKIKDMLYIASFTN